MSHVRVDSSVPRHHKFVKAGPAPAWLWLCGLAYCQEGLTDGFIPVEAIDYLGVKNARRLAEHLVRARLWETVDGGWQVHDYLDHNRSALQVNGIKKDRRKSGQSGGMASGESRRRTDTKHTREAHVEANREAKCFDNSEASCFDERSKVLRHVEASVEASVEPICTVGVPVGVLAVDAVLEMKEATDFDRFHAAYPKARRKGGYLVETMVLDAVRKAGSVDVLLAALDNHKASEQWQSPRLIPGMDVWLREERWNQQLPSADDAARAAVNAKLPAWARR